MRTGTSERRWTRSALIVSQVSLAFVLLIGSGLLTLSFARLLSVNPGFKAEHVLTAQFSLPDVRYKDDARARNFVGSLLQNLRALLGVTHVGATTYLPFSRNDNASAMTIMGTILSRLASCLQCPAGTRLILDTCQPWAFQCCRAGPSPKATRTAHRKSWSLISSWRVSTGHGATP